jgi:hypothetical protein
VARKTRKNPDPDETRMPDEGVSQDRQTVIPKARHLGGNTYCIPVSAPTPKRPIQKKHRKTKPH